MAVPAANLQQAPGAGSRGSRSGSDNRQLTELVRARVSPAELAQIERKASSAGVTVSALVRAAVLDRPLVPQADRQEIADLRRLGGLLRWWLTDGAGKDGERHVRGLPSDDEGLLIEDILAGLMESVAALEAGLEISSSRRRRRG